MKSPMLIIFALLLTHTSLAFAKSHPIKKQNLEHKTFVFAVDNVIIDGILFDYVLQEATSDDKEKLIKIAKVQDGVFAKYGLTRPDLSLEQTEAVIGRRLTKKDFDSVMNMISGKRVVKFVPQVISKIKKAGHRIMIVGSGYGTCRTLLQMSEELGVEREDIYSFFGSFDDSGKLHLENSMAGIEQCDTAKTVVRSFFKSDFIRKSKKYNKTKGQVVLISASLNDMEAYNSKESDDFIGFGILEVDEGLKSVAPNFVTTQQEFENLIDKMI